MFYAPNSKELRPAVNERGPISEKIKIALSIKCTHYLSNIFGAVVPKLVELSKQTVAQTMAQSVAQSVAQTVARSVFVSAERSFVVDLKHL